MTWLWLNIPVALVFVGAWSGIPMWLVLKAPGPGPAVTGGAGFSSDPLGCACRAADHAGPAAQRAPGGRVTAAGEAEWLPW
jgi:hypothetical protein